MAKFISMRYMILVIFCCAIKSDLYVQQMFFRWNRGRFVEQKLMLSSNFRCYQFHNNPFPRIGSHVVVLLKSDLDVRQTHLRGRFVEQKHPLSCSFRCDQIYNNNCYIFGHTLLFYLSPTWTFNKPTSGESPSCPKMIMPAKKIRLEWNLCS